MKGTVSGQDKQTLWSERIRQQAGSSLSAAAFCREQGISENSFYWWKARLGQRKEKRADIGAANAATGFIDLGAVRSASGKVCDGGVEIRLELPGGVVLTIVKH